MRFKVSISIDNISPSLVLYREIVLFFYKGKKSAFSLLKSPLQLWEFWHY